jgi:hypothetical protein
MRRGASASPSSNCTMARVDECDDGERAVLFAFVAIFEGGGEPLE